MKKRVMKFTGILLCMILVVSMLGCSKSKETSQTDTTNNTTSSDNTAADTENDTAKNDTASSEAKKIAYITPGLDLPFWRYLANGIENKVMNLGLNATVQVYDSHNSSETQLQNAQDAIVKGVDLIIISPTDSSSCPAVLTAAEEAKIPVVIADIGSDSGKYDAFIITPNKDGAYELGQYITNYMKEKGIVNKTAAQITVSLARNNGKARFEGFNQALDEAGIELADYRQLEDYTRAEAESFTQDLMTTYQDLGVIFCHTDEPTLGVVQAIQNAGKGNDIIVAGFDATTETIDAIKEGTIVAAAVQQPALMGAEAVEAAAKIFNGQTPDEQIDVPTLLVTAENVNDKDIQDKLNLDVFPEVITK